MKSFVSAVLGMLIATAVLAEVVQVVEVKIKGMTCPFCVYGIEKNLSQMPGVEQVQVSLEQKRARVTMQPGATADPEGIKKIIQDAGFTPESVTVQAGEK